MTTTRPSEDSMLASACCTRMSIWLRREGVGRGNNTTEPQQALIGYYEHGENKEAAAERREQKKEKERARGNKWKGTAWRAWIHAPPGQLAGRRCPSEDAPRAARSVSACARRQPITTREKCVQRIHTVLKALCGSHVLRKAGVSPATSIRSLRHCQRRSCGRARTAYQCQTRKDTQDGAINRRCLPACRAGRGQRQHGHIPEPP